jgi:hypothetical protein
MLLGDAGLETKVETKSVARPQGTSRGRRFIGRTVCAESRTANLELLGLVAGTCYLLIYQMYARCGVLDGKTDPILSGYHHALSLYPVAWRGFVSTAL